MKNAIMVILAILLIPLAQAGYTSNAYGSGCYGVEECPSSNSGSSEASPGTGSNVEGGGGIQLLKKYNNTEIEDTQNNTDSIEKNIEFQEPNSLPFDNSSFDNNSQTENQLETPLNETNYDISRGFLNPFPWWIIIILLTLLFILIYYLTKKEENKSHKKNLKTKKK